MLKADVVIDVHSNYYPAVEFCPVTVCEDRKVLAASVDLVEKAGLPASEIRLPAGQGWVSLAAQRAGKPSFLLEVIAHGYLDERSIRIGVHAVRNVLRALKMIDGEPTPIQGLKVPPGRFGREFVVANRGGLVHFQKTAGDWLNAGDVIAIIRNIYGDTVDEVRSPWPGYIRTCLFGQHNEAVFEGSNLCSILTADPGRRYFED
jgi:predicted deacylase